MRSALVGPLVTLAGAVLAALVTVLVTNHQQRRRASDREVLELWRAAFDRAAFKGPYTWHSDPGRFREAIELTLQCINAGVLQNRKGTILGKAKPKALMRNSALRSVGEAVERKLNRIRDLVPPDGALGPGTTPVADAIDRERDDVIDLLNDAWANARLPLLPRPTEAKSLDDVFEE
jgi:hypothetical protein